MDYFKQTVLAILSSGPVPQHIGFVMDGNRRYARRRNEQVQQGHQAGFQALRRTLEVCLRLGVKCVSVYAFSIENFKRSPTEVDAIMELAKTKLLELCGKGELLAQYGVRLNVIGQKGTLPKEVQDVVDEIERLTRHHDKAILNVCMPYTARDEITTAVQETIDKYEGRDDIAVDEITPDEIEANLATNLAGSPPLDILIRTSGVKRFSDFLLWQQSDNTQTYFTSVYWPEFGLWDFIPILFDYQRKVWSGALGPKRQEAAAGK